MSSDEWSTDTIVGVYTVVVSACMGALGFGGKLLWDRLSDLSRTRTQHEVDRIDALLKFYYPVLIRLQREQSIWDNIVAIHRVPPRASGSIHLSEVSVGIDDPDDAQIVEALDATNLQHHEELQSLIIDHIVEARPRADMVELFLQYDEHVTLYRALRQIGRRDFPAVFGCPYPSSLLRLVKERIAALEAERAAVGESKWWFFAPRAAAGE